jgi:hypothetical protein
MFGLWAAMGVLTELVMSLGSGGLRRRPVPQCGA